MAQGDIESRIQLVFSPNNETLKKKNLSILDDMSYYDRKLKKFIEDHDILIPILPIPGDNYKIGMFPLSVIVVNDEIKVRAQRTTQPYKPLLEFIMTYEKAI